MPAATLAERCLRIAWLALLAWQPLWHAALPEPAGSRNAWLAVLAALPLLALTPGVLRGRPRSRYWAMFLVMAYFIVGIVEAWANPPQRAAATMQILLCLGYFGGLVLISRASR